MNRKVTDYINNAPPAQQEVMNIIRKLIHQSLSGVTEEFKWNQPVFKLKKDFAYLKTAKAHVTFGFINFEKISDKKGKMEGTGKGMRHIKIKSASEIDPTELREWLLAITGEA